jgi:hypothetical protein
MTPLTATSAEPARLDRPVLPSGPLADELGQNRLRQWPGKPRSVDEVTRRLKAALSDAPHARLPAGWSQWGGTMSKRFDVFSINGYKDRFPGDMINDLYERVELPVMVGEWHFGALDVGLPGGCLRRVASQHDRGEAYRVYAEGALAHPACVGVH